MLLIRTTHFFGASSLAIIGLHPVDAASAVSTFIILTCGFTNWAVSLTDRRSPNPVAIILRQRLLDIELAISNIDS